jgi:hypothetical protein
MTKISLDLGTAAASPNNSVICALDHSRRFVRRYSRPDQGEMWSTAKRLREVVLHVRRCVVANLPSALSLEAVAQFVARHAGRERDAVFLCSGVEN